MLDVGVIAGLLLACAAIGFPVCLLFAADKFALRFAAASPIGFGLFATAATIFYRCGVAPWLTALVMVALSLAVAAIWFFRARALRWPASQTSFGLAVGTAAVALICLLPAWTGGVHFRVFQANVYDEMFYQGAAAAYRTHSVAAMTDEASATAANSVVARALRFLSNRGSVAVAYSAVTAITGQSEASGAYAFKVALQVNMLFAMLFVLVNVFSASYPLAFALSAALTVGFFEQNAFDIDAWSELAALPIYLLLTGCAVLAFDPARFGTFRSSDVPRLGTIFGLPLAAVLYLYPEALSIYGSTGVVIAATAAVSRDTRQAVKGGLLAVALATIIALAISALFWSGTLEFAMYRFGRASASAQDWWRYFQRYLFGSEDNYLKILFDQHGSRRAFLNAAFSLPVEFVIGAIGLYFLLPTPNTPLVAAVAWKLVLYAFAIVLAASAVISAIRIWRSNSSGAPARMIVACVAACVVPVIIGLAGHLWAAGKGLSMASPLLFVLLSLPLLAPSTPAAFWPLGRIASLGFVAAHLLLGALRPFLVTQAAGYQLPGLPTAAAQANGQKANLDWDANHLIDEFRGCKGVVLRVDQPFMVQFAQNVLTGMRAKWANPAEQIWPRGPFPAYLPDGWETFDCVATEMTTILKPGQKLIRLSKDQSLFAFLQAPAGELEIGAAEPAGTTRTGTYEVEGTSGGPLRWTAQTAEFGVPANPAAPAKSLRLALWPMPLAAHRLKVSVGGKTIYDGAIPTGEVTLPLGQFADQQTLAIALQTDAPTHFPGDPRALGVALKELRLSK